ncbi:C4-dicarboxylate TRAP transporter substrate-binding protein [Sneathiella sp.]|uniref:C4-dicarboxylate TRAP transporter substrate-binding protein n=1 Tax=Sneathiella sp. TaxID=1964365 RepID=UPI00356A0311
MRLPIILTVALALTSAIPIVAKAADPVKIIYASYVPLKHPTNITLEKFFSKIEKDSGGSIEFDRQFGSVLLGAKDIPSGVRDGLADSGYMLGIFVPSEMPVDNYIGDFSMLNDDPLAITGALNELVIQNCPQCTNEYENDFKVKYLGTYALTPYLLQCKEERKNLEDFKNVKVRGFSSIAEMIKEMGGIPVGVTTSEMYEALDRGVIDCTAHMLASQKSFSLGEVAKYTILDPLGGFMGGSMLNMRLEKWAELSPEQRQIIINNLPSVIAETTFSYVHSDGEVQKEMEAKGNKFYHADKEMVSFINNFRKDYIDNRIVAKGKERGVKDPEKIKASIIRLKAEWTKLLDERGRDEETFAELLKERIYSKMSVE